MVSSRITSDLPDMDDERVPTATLLRDGDDLLAAALGAYGGELLSSAPRQTTYSPGRSLTVRYDARVRWEDGSITDEMLVATAGRKVPKGALVLEDGDLKVGIWRVPHDPRLPGLAPAMDPARTAALLTELGAPVTSATPRLVAYRPGRRAVVEVVAPGTRIFLKVVRPRDAEALHRRHELLADHVPVPRSFGWSEELGLVALQAVGGRTLREVLAAGGLMPGAGALTTMLDALPDPAEVTVGAQTTPTWQAERFAGIIAASAPELTPRLDELAGALEAAEAVRSQPLVPVHGDLHEAQLLVDDGRISGLLDIDTFGVGHRVDDLATMIGHLSTLALGSPRRKAIELYAGRLLNAFDKTVDPVDLRRAISAVVLGLATGPFRVLQPEWRRGTVARVHLAEQWLASADRLSASPVAS
jgi:hypothetical protein